MRYQYPWYYRKFKCIGSDCEESCCQGWQIAIDPPSCRNYRKIRGEFGRELRRNIDFKNRCFHMKEERCPFWRKDRLCDIYLRLGERALCRTCRTYPRHVEDFGDLREHSLALSCPESARLILGSCHGTELEKREKRNDDSGEVDLAFLSTLESSRKVIFHFLSDHTKRLPVRIAMVLSFAHDIQRRLILDETETIPRLSARYQKQSALDRFELQISEYKEEDSRAFVLMPAILRCFAGLEPVVPDWNFKIETMISCLFHSKNESVEIPEHSRSMGGFLSEAADENLLIYLIYVYYLGAVYDRDVYSKVKLAVTSYLVIREMNRFTWVRTGALTFEDYVKNASLFSRVVENSENNLSHLEECFCKNPLFGLRNLLVCVLN